MTDAGGDAGCGTGVCRTGEWRDYASNMCKACPGGVLQCTNVTSSWDEMSKILSFELVPGTADVSSGSAVITVGTCTGGSAPDATEVTLPLAASGNLLVANGSLGAPTKRPCGRITLNLRDVCCGTHTLAMGLYVDSSTGQATSVACL
jgi:hypothetical protein